MSDLSKIAKDAADELAAGGEKGGKAVVEHLGDIGGELKAGAGRYRMTEGTNGQLFSVIMDGGAKDAEGAEGAADTVGKDAATSTTDAAAHDASAAAAGADPADGLPEPGPDPGHQIALGGDAATGDVSSSSGEAVFWSGATELKPGESAPWPGAVTRTMPDGKVLLLAGEDNAKTIARSEGKVSLESLIEDRGISMPAWKPNDPAVDQAWKDISDRYAQGVSGDVHVVLGDSLRPGNIWETVERPRLEANPAVTSITKIDLKTLEETELWRRGGT